MYNVQIKRKDSKGNIVPLNPLTKDKNISLSGSNKNLPSGSSTVADVMNKLGTLAFADSIDIPTASTTVSGVVQLSSDISNTKDESKAATIKAVGDVNAKAVHITGDESIKGKKDFKDGIVVGGNLKVSSVTDTSGNVTVNFTQI